MGKKIENYQDQRDITTRNILNNEHETNQLLSHMFANNDRDRTEVVIKIMQDEDLQVLRDGSFITAVGEIDMDGNSLRLQSSKMGPMLLTTATKNTLIKKFEEAKSSMLFKDMICSTISAVLVGVIARRFYLKKKQERRDRDMQEALDSSRRSRRANTRQTDILEKDMCVVCVSNPKEVICLPCGHVCLCEDCSLKVKDSCPICRAIIDTRAAAFV